MTLVDFFKKSLTDPAVFWGMLEAFGTIGASALALFFGYRSITQQKRNKPDLRVSLDLLNDYIQVLVVENIGPVTAHAVNLRCLSALYNNKEMLNVE